MTFDTKAINLSGGPVDLVADTDIASAIAAGGASGARVSCRTSARMTR